MQVEGNHTKTLHANGLVSVEDHWAQITAVNMAYEARYRPGCSVYRTIHRDEIKIDAPTHPDEDDRIGTIIGYAARPTLLSNPAGGGQVIRYNPILIKWGGLKYKYRQAYAYAMSEVLLYDHQDATGATSGDAAMGNTSQVG